MTGCINATVSRYIATATRLCAYKSIDWKINYIRKYLKENKKKSLINKKRARLIKLIKLIFITNPSTISFLLDALTLPNCCQIIVQLYDKHTRM